MNLTTIFVVGIVCWALVEIIRHLSENARKKHAHNDALIKQVSELQERVQTLEKIVTSNDYDLKRQFDELNR